jgi:hypothetical protein
VVTFLGQSSCGFLWHGAYPRLYSRSPSASRCAWQEEGCPKISISLGFDSDSYTESDRNRSLPLTVYEPSFSPQKLV